jgi:iron(III) transport system substrate-binding protein
VKRFFLFLLLAFLFSLFVYYSPAFWTKPTLYLFSDWDSRLISDGVTRYEEQTGISIRLTGDQKKADLFLLKDIVSITERADFSVLSSFILDRNVPEKFRDPGHKWFGVFYRAEALIYHADNVSQKIRLSYMASDCIATSSRQSLVRKSSEWLDKLPASVYDKDEKLIEDVERGKCTLGVVAAASLGRYNETFLESRVRLRWPKTVILTIAGGAIPVTSQQKKVAQEFLEWLTAFPQQWGFAKQRFEYTVNKRAKLSDRVLVWGPFREWK